MSSWSWAGSPRRVRRGALLAAVTAAVWTAGACAAITSDPTVPASIERVAKPFPSIAVGDTLRDTLGVAQPLRVVVRDLAGDPITDAPVRFQYVQFDRDSALDVDSITGFVRAVKLPTGSPVLVAARVGTFIQVLDTVRVVVPPDMVSLTRDTAIVGFVPDTGARGIDNNSAPVEVKLQSDSAGTLRDAQGWLVRFAILRPFNPTNDTTAAAFLISETTARPSQFDTSGTTGLAARRVRIRPNIFPSGTTLCDTVLVEAMVVRRGEPIVGAPDTVVVPVSAASTRGSGGGCGEGAAPAPARR